MCSTFNVLRFLVSKCVTDEFSVFAQYSKLIAEVGIGGFEGGRGIMTSSYSDSSGHWGGSWMDEENTKASWASIKSQSSPEIQSLLFRSGLLLCWSWIRPLCVWNLFICHWTTSRVRPSSCTHLRSALCFLFKWSHVGSNEVRMSHSPLSHLLSYERAWECRSEDWESSLNVTHTVQDVAETAK